MSLSDYSSDDSLEEEPPIAVEAIKGVARSARTGGPSSMNTSSRSMVKALRFLCSMSDTKAFGSTR